MVLQLANEGWDEVNEQVLGVHAVRQRWSSGLTNRGNPV